MVMLPRVAAIGRNCEVKENFLLLVLLLAVVGEEAGLWFQAS
jgi:hypothetical protein